jgi:CRP-like cAMP-binding protein
MSSTDSPLAKLVRKLASRNALDDDDRTAILALPYVTRTYEASSYLVREGEPPKRYCSFVISGFAFRQKLTVHGTRQIVSIHMAGDILDLQHLFLKCADQNVQALTRLETAELDREGLRALAIERPAVAEAMWVDALIDASIFREWVMNVGRRDARSRIAHLLCEFATRMDVMGLNNGGRYELPMTQEQIGDATGLTSVHVNRTLKSLSADGLVHRDRRYLSFSDWESIRAVADFSALYLHIDQSVPEDDAARA